MTQIDPDDPDLEPSPPPRRGWGRFLRRGALVLLALALLTASARWQIGRIGRHQLDTVSAGIDSSDPGWRWPDIDKARRDAAPPEDRNPANIVLQLKRELPQRWEEYRKHRDWEWGPVTHRPPSFVEFVWLLGGKNAAGADRQRVRDRLLAPEVLACQSGHYPLVPKDNPFLMLLPHLQEARSLVDWLDFDGRLAVVEGRPADAIAASRAALVVSRSVGDEPTLISQLVRMAMARVSAQLAIQTLAWCEPAGPSLADLQRELRAEAEVPWLRYGLRGERAFFNQFFDGMREGKLTVKDLEMLEGNSHGNATLHAAGLELYKPLIAGDQARALEILTAYIDATRLPSHEQLAAIKAIPLPPRPPEDFRYVGTSLLIPACAKVAEAGLRTRAELLTASAAIGCERFRQAHGRWPKLLAEIPAEILPPDLAPDPFNGRPIQYRRLPDGVVLFAGESPNLHQTETSTPFEKAQTSDVGRCWRLWDPGRRRQHPPEATEAETK